MKVALYLRVSTREQTENYSLENQQEKLESFCKAKGWEAYQVYVDGGFSGSDMNRPDLQRMLNDIKFKEIDSVMVLKLDRLSRSQRDTLELIEDHFLKNEVNFISVTESLDTTTPMGRAMIGIMSAFAQLEREMIAERMRDGQIKRAQEGYAAMGGNYNPAGFKRSSGELVTLDNEKEHIKKAFQLYSKLHSITKVQNELKILGFPVWRFRRYRDILQNPLYNGKVTYSKNSYPGRHEKFIDDELFNNVQKLLKRHRGHNFHKAKESLLAGLISCSSCGERYLTYTVNHTLKCGEKVQYRYYICRARRFPSEYPKKCMNKTWNAEKLERLIRDELQLLKIDKEKNDQDNNEIDYTQVINNIDNKIERIIDLYADGNFDRELLDKRISIYNKEKEAILKRREGQEEAKNKLMSKDIKDYVISLKRADFTTRRAIVEKLITQIYINDKNVTLEWEF